jgi:hypothetical protein
MPLHYSHATPISAASRGVNSFALVFLICRIPSWRIFRSKEVHDIESSGNSW